MWRHGEGAPGRCQVSLSSGCGYDSNGVVQEVLHEGDAVFGVVDGAFGRIAGDDSVDEMAVFEEIAVEAVEFVTAGEFFAVEDDAGFIGLASGGQ